jgi:hypothetical protein
MLLTAHQLRFPLPQVSRDSPHTWQLLPALGAALRARGVTVTPSETGLTFSHFPGRGHAGNLLRGTVALDDQGPAPALLCQLDSTPLLLQVTVAGLLGFLLLAIRLGSPWFSGVWAVALAVVVHALLHRYAILRFKALLQTVVPGSAS